ncbi:hypothetical protein [Mucilaginibacter sp. HD30]
MKKTYLSLFALFAALQLSYAQWTTGTNIYNTNTGNVGIGTASPVNKLDVQGGNGSVYNNGTVTNFLVGSAAYGKTSIFLVTSADAGGYGILQSIDKSGINWGNTIINPQGGDVGIGTDNPKGYKLAVNGSAIATSIKVMLNANWPDFVFLKDYKLPTLTELKTYVDKNQHLPDMPSADEVHAKGLDLGEMNRLLLKKVEELTLYLIENDARYKEKNKTVESLQVQSEQQSKEILELKEQISKLSKNIALTTP